MSAVAFKIMPGRGIIERVSVQGRFRVMRVAAADAEDKKKDGVPVDLAGQELGDNVLDELDYVQGHMAIYRGQRPRDECPVTIKVFSLIGRRGDEHKALAERIEAAPKLRHDNIERIYETGRKGEHFFVATERLEGESLGDKVERDGALPPASAVIVLTVSLSALTALHNRSQAHGDISPKTVFLCNDGTIKITGLGQSQGTEDSLSIGGDHLGDPDYLAPERIDGRPPDPVSDLYSLGHTFYFLLTGRAPFAGNSPIATMICQLNQDPPDLARMAEGISEGMLKIYKKMTGKALDVRYRDAGDALNDIKMLDAGRDNRIELFAEPESKKDKVFKVVKTSLVGVGVLFVLLLIAHLLSLAVIFLTDLGDPMRNHSLPLTPELRAPSDNAPANTDRPDKSKE